MFDKYMIHDASCKNVIKNGKIIGFQIGVRVTYYRGIMIAVIKDFNLCVDTIKYSANDMTYTFNGNTYTFEEMFGVTDERWNFGDVALLTVIKPDGLSIGEHEIEVTEELRISYGLMDNYYKNTAHWKKKVYFSGNIRRGVSLYSYQQEYYLRQMDLEACIKAVSELGADGIEIISEAMIENFPNPSQVWVDNWFALLKKYNCTATCYDAFMDGRICGEQMISDDEAVAQMERDIKLAKRLGFLFIRVLCAVPLRIIERALPLAQELDIKLGIEIHSPFRLATPWIDEYITFIKRTGTKHFGIIPDFGIFVKRPVRILVRKHLREGATEAIVNYICECYENNISKDDMMAKVVTMNPNNVDLFWADEAYHYTYCDPQLLAQYVPYIIHIHAKLYEMTLENGIWEEYSIPNKEIIEVLKDNGWAGYINTEYEGQRHYHDLENFDVDSVEQVKNHHNMLKRYIQA